MLNNDKTDTLDELFEQARRLSDAPISQSFEAQLLAAARQQQIAARSEKKGAGDFFGFLFGWRPGLAFATAMVLGVSFGLAEQSGYMPFDTPLEESDVMFEALYPLGDMGWGEI